MADTVPSAVWGYRGLYVLIAAGLLFLRLLPLGSEAGSWPAPDLLFAMTLTWVLRRPDYVPALLIAVVFLLEDMLTMRPPGLWAAIVVVASEFMRGRAALSREVSFVVEWLIVGIVMVASVLAYRLMLSLVMLPQVSLAQSVIQLVLTILSYPVVVVVSRLALGVRKPATGEVDAYGRRL